MAGLSSAAPAGYSQVWSDEFNGAVGSAPNSANWTYNTGDTGWGNNELENYTNSTANAQIVADPNATDGKSLAIIAVDTQPGNANYGTVGRYTSARLLSNASGFQGVTFQYGYMEARIQMPYGDGIWPAFWMLGTSINSGTAWPNCGEMDIMENIGNPATYNGNPADQGNNHGSLHAPNWNPSAIYTLPAGALYHNAYHTFGILWQANQVQFYVDDTLYETQTSAGAASAGGTYEFNNTFFFLLNMAVGGNWPGKPDATTSFPQTMLVDYVRAYEPDTPTPSPTLTSTPTATSTATPSPTLTLTPTSSFTVTPTPTWAATLPTTPSNTASFTSTSTLSFTPTGTMTPSATTSQTPTGSMTPTGTASLTASWTSTPVYTVSSIDTGTPTSTETPTQTATNSPTPTASNSATGTPTATPSPTNTLTATPLGTPTDTPGPANTSTATAIPVVTSVMVGNPYPNPSGNGPVLIPLWFPADSMIEWSVFTTAYRKILDHPQSVSGTNTILSWNLKDSWASPVANGLYYLRVQVTGPVQSSKILKILVIR